MAHMVVSPNFQDVASEFRDIASQRDVTGLAGIAVAGAGGGILAQEVADRVLPALGMSRTPQSTSDFAASFAVKLVAALGLGIAAIRVGTGSVGQVLAVGAAGATVLAGADFFDAVQRSGFLAEMPVGGSRHAIGTASPSPAPPSRASPRPNDGPAVTGSTADATVATQGR